MKRGGGVYTVPAATGPRWVNKVDGEVVSRHRVKRAAVRKGRSIARRLEVEHTISKTDGRFGEKNSYGNDPCPPRDE